MATTIGINWIQWLRDRSRERNIDEIFEQYGMQYYLWLYSSEADKKYLHIDKNVVVQGEIYAACEAKRKNRMRAIGEITIFSTFICDSIKVSIGIKLHKSIVFSAFCVSFGWMIRWNMKVMCVVRHRIHIFWCEVWLMDSSEVVSFISEPSIRWHTFIQISTAYELSSHLIIDWCSVHFGATEGFFHRQWQKRHLMSSFIHFSKLPFFHFFFFYWKYLDGKIGCVNIGLQFKFE